MILDNEIQRKLLLEMFDIVSIPGKLLEQAFIVKQALVAAKIAKTEPATESPNG